MGRAVSASPWVAQTATGRAGFVRVQVAPLIGAPAITPMARNTSLMLHAAVYDMEPPKLNPVAKYRALSTQYLASITALMARVIISSCPPLFEKPAVLPSPLRTRKMTFVSLLLSWYIVIPDLALPPSG